tara:strand:+ start:98 stop:1171 length:1074 start_codon:yes stop_codon:yes gene_type:complete
MSYLIPYIFLVFFSIRNNRKFTKFTSIIIWISLVLFIGLRFEVGADWFNYKLSVERAGEVDVDYSELLLRSFSPGYAFLLTICAKYKWGVVGLNIINAGLFSGGLVYFCSKLKNPFLGLIASYPYLIVVVSMGYIIQASSIGILLVGLTFYQNSNFKVFYLTIILASLFHFSAFLSILIPLFDQIRLIKRKSSLISISLIIGVFGILYLRFLDDYFISFYNSYFGRDMQAAGPKLLILVFFAIIFFIQRNRFEFSTQQKNIMYSLSTISILLFFYSLTIKATIATYRLSLFFYSLQLYVTSYLPYTRFLNISAKNWTILFYIYNFMILFVWILFANMSYAWLPYENILIKKIFFLFN